MNKLNKGKKVGIVICALASISLVGIGFSTWIIQTRTESKVDNISVTVAETKNASIVISEASASDDKVNFDADYNKHTADSLISCGSSDTEDLSFTLKYTVTVGTSVSSFEIKAAIDDTTSAGGGKYTKAVETYKYIELPSTLGLKKTTDGTSTTDNSKVCLTQASSTTDGLKVTTTSDTSAQTTKYEVEQVFTFSWGEAFKKKNPVAVSPSDSIYTYSTSGSTANATVETLTANTKGLKSLELSSFNVIFSIGSVETSTN